MKIYNVYGVKISVDEVLAGAFDMEYSMFRIAGNGEEKHSRRY